MILADTSIWVDHLRVVDVTLTQLLDTGKVLTHPFVVGELALGNLRHRRRFLDTFGDLPRTAVASDWEVMQFIERHELFGLGIGYIDAHLLTAVRLTFDAVLWTRDKRLLRAAGRLGVVANLS
jgi:predicted nucleic acid-binding protein